MNNPLSPPAACSPASHLDAHSPPSDGSSVDECGTGSAGVDGQTAGDETAGETESTDGGRTFDAEHDARVARLRDALPDGSPLRGVVESLAAARDDLLVQERRFARDPQMAAWYRGCASGLEVAFASLAAWMVRP